LPGSSRRVEASCREEQADGKKAEGQDEQEKAFRIYETFHGDKRL
jgi:hypothetical protein